MTAEVWAESLGPGIPYLLTLGADGTAEIWSLFSVSSYPYLSVWRAEQ